MQASANKVTFQFTLLKLTEIIFLLNVIHSKQTTLFDGWMLRHSNLMRNKKVKQKGKKYYREKADYHRQT